MNEFINLDAQDELSHFAQVTTEELDPQLDAASDQRWQDKFDYLLSLHEEIRPQLAAKRSKDEELELRSTGWFGGE